MRERPLHGARASALRAESTGDPASAGVPVSAGVASGAPVSFMITPVSGVVSAVRARRVGGGEARVARLDAGPDPASPPQAGVVPSMHPRSATAEETSTPDARTAGDCRSFEPELTITRDSTASVRRKQRYWDVDLGATPCRRREPRPLAEAIRDARGDARIGGIARHDRGRADRSAVADAHADDDLPLHVESSARASS